MPLKPVAVNSLRVVTYIDGFNLYYGLKSARFERYLWLDVVRLSLNLLKPGQKLVGVKYFTSRISGPEDKRKRQNTFLEALGTLRPLDVFYGHFLEKPRECFKCGYKWPGYEEKMTDVNIATQLLVDAYENIYDCGIIISGDSDLVPPVDAIRKHFPQKRMIVAFPPERRSDMLKNACNAWFHIGRATLDESQLPDEVVKADGFKLTRPLTWM